MTRTKLEAMAAAYVEELDFIDNQNRRIAGNAFLAGAAAMNEMAAKEVAQFTGSEAIVHNVRALMGEGE